VEDVETKTDLQKELPISTNSADEADEDTTKDEDTIKELATSLNADTSVAEEYDDCPEKEDEGNRANEQLKEAAEGRRSRRSVRPMARFTENNPLYVLECFSILRHLETTSNCNF